MANSGVKVNMAPSRPGDFIRTEVIEELGLSVTKAANILGPTYLLGQAGGWSVVSPRWSL